jgi:hypothetical protein
MNPLFERKNWPLLNELMEWNLERWDKELNKAIFKKKPKPKPKPKTKGGYFS